MTITEPWGVDSIGKLNEWIETCGMPTDPLPPAGEAEVDAFAFGFGFRFPPDDRVASNAGYRQLAQTLASALYVRFVDAPEGAIAIWRARPEFTEEAVFSYIETIDGSPVNWERMEDDDDDYRATMTREIPTDDRCGKIYAGLMLVKLKA